MTARGIIVSAARSGAGKTTVALGLLAALKRRCIAVRAAKAGPDYIDPAFHAAATGASGVNLDTWAMPPGLIAALVANAARDADMLVIEGAMGLFDGVPGKAGRSGAAADLARRFGVPVVLVLDVTGQSQSAAAVVAGFAKFDPAVRLAGVVLNRVGSERHRMLVADAIAPLGVSVLGAIPRDAALALPERHLGLVQAGEHADLSARLARLAEAVETHCNVAAICDAAAPIQDRHARTYAAHPRRTMASAGARTWMTGSSSVMTSAEGVLRPPGQRIALACDAAFTFMYPHLLDGWRRAGADIVRFAALADEGPADDCDTCWLPGGYPELHAGALAAAQNFRTRLVRFAATRPVHAECGGYMVLGEGLIDADGTHHAMAGLLGHATSFAKRKLHLGYRAARLLADCPIGVAGALVRGHEFHHATVIAPGRDQPLAEITDAQGRAVDVAGSRRGHVSGTFFHVIAGEP